MVTNRLVGLNPNEFGGRTPARQPAPPPPPPQTEGKRNLVERKAPELFKFQSPGDLVSGIITAIERVTVNNKPCVQYVIRNREENKTYQILGTYDINVKLTTADKGKYVEICFRGNHPTIQKNGNPMMEFVVAVEEGKSTFADGTHITDEDIPF